MHRRQSWAAPVAAFMISAALLSGCTGDNPGDEATTAEASPTSAAPSPEPESTPSDEPSLSPAEEAAQEAQVTYLRWNDFRNQTLQDPPPISGDDADADAAFEQLLQDVRLLASGDSEGTFISSVGQYDQRGWRQVGGNSVEGVLATEVELSPQDEPSAAFAVLELCLVPSDDFGVITEEGAPAPEFENVVPEPIPLRVRVERSEAQDERWLVTESERREGESC